MSLEFLALCPCSTLRCSILLDPRFVELIVLKKKNIYVFFIIFASTILISIFMAKIHGLFGSALTGSAAKSTFYKSAFDGQTIMRAKAASVKNPNTVEQVRNRIFTKANSKAYAALKIIADHSFEGVPYGAKSMQEFLKLNYPIIASMAGQNVFPLKSVNGLAIVGYQISSGTLPSPASFENDGQEAQMDFSSVIASADSISAKQLADVLKVSLGDQVTAVFLNTGPVDASNASDVVLCTRFAFKIPEEGDSVVIKSGIMDKAIYADNNSYNGPANFIADTDRKKLSLVLPGVPYGAVLAGLIVSRKVGEQWKRSTSYLANTANILGADWKEVMKSWSPSGTRYLNQANM